jgi:hypothetical protein
VVLALVDRLEPGGLLQRDHSICKDPFGMQRSAWCDQPLLHYEMDLDLRMQSRGLPVQPIKVASEPKITQFMGAARSLVRKKL